jgi:hypothetical protein
LAVVVALDGKALTGLIVMVVAAVERVVVMVGRVTILTLIRLPEVGVVELVR